MDVMMPLTPLPPAPDRRIGDQRRFDEAAYASLKGQERMVAELNEGFIPPFNAALPAVLDAYDHREVILASPDNARRAEEARDKAEAWADAPVGVLVETGRHSAFHWSEVARAAAGETAKQRVQRAWALTGDIADGGVLTLPVGMTYTAGMATLSLSYRGVELYPGYQYEERGERGTPSSEVILRFDAAAGSLIRAYVIAGPAGESDAPTPGTAQKLAAAAWTLERAVIAEGIISLPAPLAYRPGYSELRLSARGLTLYAGEHFAEVGTGTATSNAVRIKFPLAAGTQMHAVIMSNVYDSTREDT